MAIHSVALMDAVFERQKAGQGSYEGRHVAAHSVDASPPAQKSRELAVSETNPSTENAHDCQGENLRSRYWPFPVTQGFRELHHCD